MKREIVDALIASLNDPDAGWEFSKYRAKNTRIKCDIWIASGPGFLQVVFYGNAIGSTCSYRAKGTLLFHPHWARRIYNAARPHQLASLSGNNARTSRRIVDAIHAASTQVEAA